MKCRLGHMICIGFVIWTAVAVRAQTVTTLVEFNGGDGVGPGSLTQGVDGNLYGTTSLATKYWGTLFRMTPAGTLTAVYGFVCRVGQCPQGGQPDNPLLLGTDGAFYGATAIGGDSSQCGEYGCGTIFKISSNGKLTTLHDFEGVDGASPNRLVQANGSLYGTAAAGGASNGGTFFKISSNGVFATLFSFGVGASPVGAIQGTDGDFYGATVGGGIKLCAENQNGCGTVFKISASGNGALLYKFCSQPTCADGSWPSGNLIQALDGNFYGLTLFGGANGQGTAFKITPTGSLTILYSFCSEPSCGDGGNPSGPLFQATDGNLYGMTNFGGDLTCSPPSGCGTIFQITPSGVLTTISNFEFSDSNGGGGLYQATNGLLYGSTFRGGNLECVDSSAGCGTIFSLDMDLGPFVAFAHNSAKAGQKFGILGQGFTGTSNVSFNGISTNFTVVSDTFITATVPAGATTGYVMVTTPGGTLTSNVPFQVIP